MTPIHLAIRDLALQIEIMLYRLEDIKYCGNFISINMVNIDSTYALIYKEIHDTKCMWCQLADTNKWLSIN